MADEGGEKKRGRPGRAAKVEVAVVEKPKAEKRKAAPKESSGEGGSPAKRGRGRPKGGGRKKAKGKAKKVSLNKHVKLYLSNDVNVIYRAQALLLVVVAAEVVQPRKLLQKRRISPVVERSLGATKQKIFLKFLPTSTYTSVSQLKCETQNYS
jgi:hypothetical protein